MRIYPRSTAIPPSPIGKTAVVPLMSADDIFQAEQAVIQNTKPGEALYISHYSLPGLHEGPSTGTPASNAQRTFLDTLLQQIKDNKVQAYLVADNSKNASNHGTNNLRNEQTICFLNQSGAFILPYPNQYVLINHSKFVANKDYAVVSSCNLSSHSSDSPDYNTGFLVKGPAAQNGILHAFIPQWNFAVQEDHRGWAIKYPSPEQDLSFNPDSRVAWLNTAPKEEIQSNADATEIKLVYENLIYEAGKGPSNAYLYFAHFDFSNLQIVSDVRKAHEKNPSLDIRFILDPNQYLEGLSLGSRDPRVIAYQELVQEGILVRFARVVQHPNASEDPQRFHDKFVVYNDEKILNGSGNLSAHSLNGNILNSQTETKALKDKLPLHNREIDVLVKEPLSAKIFKEKFLSDWVYRSVTDPILASGFKGGFNTNNVEQL